MLLQQSGRGRGRRCSKLTVFRAMCSKFNYYGDSLKIRKAVIPDDVLVFTNKKYLGGFKIDVNLERVLNLDQNPMPPRVVVEEIPKRLLEAPLDMDQELEDRELIGDYNVYWQKKMTYFYKWLIERDYFSSHRPHFVLVSGNIEDFLVAPYNSKCGWCIYARRFKGTIYFRSSGSFKLDSADVVATPESRETRRVGHDKRYSCIGLQFCRQVVKLQEKSEKEQVFAAYESDFGRYKILSLNMVHAVESGSEVVSPKFVDVKLANTRSAKSYSMQLLTRWAKSVVFDQDKLIVGELEGDTTLINVNIVPTSKVPALAADYWQEGVCYDFLKRFLGFVWRKVETEDPSVVYCFERRQLRFVSCTRMLVSETGLTDDFKAVIPDFLVEHLSR